jgi:sec-independent protein translocase protein TatA
MGLGGLGMWEMIMIFLVVLLLFGAKRLPEIGSSLGKGIREFKGSIKEIEKEVKAVGEEPTRDAVPSTSDTSNEPDEGPRRLTTTPGSDSGEIQAGGVPTQEGPKQDGPGTTEEHAEEASNEHGEDDPNELGQASA